MKFDTYHIQGTEGVSTVAPFGELRAGFDTAQQVGPTQGERPKEIASPQVSLNKLGTGFVVLQRKDSSGRQLGGAPQDDDT